MVAEITTTSSALSLPDEARAIVESRIGSEQWNEIDRVEQEMAKLPQQICPLRHIFTHDADGNVNLYTRLIFMAAGTRLTSRIHMFEHPHFVLQGKFKVLDDDNGWQIISAPYIGITKPGTRRVLIILEDTLFATVHVTVLDDPEKIVEAVTYPHMDLGHMDSISKEQMAAIKLNQKGGVQ
jgi:hypothetical protein